MHISEKSTKETTDKTLKRVYIKISNAKNTLLGNYREIKGKYLQLYLNEVGIPSINVGYGMSSSSQIQPVGDIIGQAFI